MVLPLFIVSCVHINHKGRFSQQETLYMAAAAYLEAFSIIER